MERDPDVELDEILATLTLVNVDREAADHLTERLVHVLVERMFLDLRRQLVSGDLSRRHYVEQLRWLIVRCRAVGLLPAQLY